MSERDSTHDLAGQDRGAATTGNAEGATAPGTMLGAVAQQVGPVAIQRRILQRKAAGSGDAPGTGAQASGAGDPLPPPVQQKMEHSLGGDFSSVRVHQGPQAEAAGAVAYTQGTDIHFASGQYQPHSPSGQELLGHELAHVMQQSSGRVQPTMQAKGLPVNDDPALEREADEAGARAARGEVAASSTATGNPAPARAAAQLMRADRGAVIQRSGGGNSGGSDGKRKDDEQKDKKDDEQKADKDDEQKERLDGKKEKRKREKKRAHDAPRLIERDDDEDEQDVGGRMTELENRINLFVFALIDLIGDLSRTGNIDYLGDAVPASQGEYLKCLKAIAELSGAIGGGDEKARARLNRIASLCGHFKHLVDELKRLARSLEGQAQAQDGGQKPQAPQLDFQPTAEQKEAARTLLKTWRVVHRIGTVVNHDQIHGGSYTEARGRDLEAKHGPGHLTGEYGLHSVKIQGGLEKQRDLRVHHPKTPAYMRDSHADVDPSFKELLKLRGHDPGELDFSLFLVNSPVVIDKLEFFLGDVYEKIFAAKIKHAIKCTKLANGVYLLDLNLVKQHIPAFDDTTQKDPPFVVLRAIIKSIGATPSHYEVLKILGGGEQKSKDAATADNVRLLQEVLACEAAQKLRQLTGLGKHHLCAVIQTALDLVGGLKDCAGKPKFDHNLLVQDALIQIKNLLSALWVSKDNTERATRIYDLLMEELYLVLGTAKPHDPKDYAGTVGAIQDERAPELTQHPKWKRQTHLAASGMDALTTGFQAASEAHKQDGFTMPEKDKGTDYFEVKPVVDYKGGINDKGAVVVYCLNPSTPLHAPDPANLIQVVKGKLQGKKGLSSVSVVIDITIETDSGKNSQLDQILAGLAAEIDKGQVQVIIAKSYQKYASHGTGKVMAGNVTAINNGASKWKDTQKFLRRAEEGSDNQDLDETQLMTHMLKHGHKGELGLIQQASENAEFVHQMWPDAPGDRDSNSLPGLPFLLKPSEPIGGINKDTFSAVEQLGLETRDSFSFQNSSALGFGSPGERVLRINTGQESKEELTEKFFAMGQLHSQKKREKLVNHDPNPITIALADVIHLIEREIEEQGIDVARAGRDYNTLFRIIHIGLGRHRGNNLFCNRIASCLHFAVVLLDPQGAEAAQVVELLDGFLVTDPVGLSAGMSRQLATHFVNLTLLCGAGAIQKKLPSLKKVCISLPAFEGYRIYEKRLTEVVCGALAEEERGLLAAALLHGVPASELVELLNVLKKSGQKAKERALRALVKDLLPLPLLRDRGLLDDDITGPIPGEKKTELKNKKTTGYELR